RREPGVRALDAVTLVWAAALAFLWIGLVPLLGPPSKAVFRYPGPLLPAACWGLLVAAVVTVAGIAALARAARAAPRSGRWWLGRGGSLAVLSLCALEFYRMGLLGLSGW